MKYGYEGKENSELIENYTIVHNNIVIHFLDESTYKIPYSEENEKEIINDMITQAIDRNRSNALINAKEIRRKEFAISAIAAAIVTCDIWRLYNSPENKTHIKFAIGITSAVTLITLLYGCLYNDKINELKKYDIYLSIIDDLEEFKNNSNVIQFFKNGKELTINTLDDYTLKEIKSVNNCLQKCKKYNKR